MKAADILKHVGRWAWIVVRFVVFGVGGFWAMLLGFCMFIARFLGDGSFGLSPFLSLPLILAGTVMMLYGTGEWGRWAYLWVFLSMPICLLVLFLLPGSGPEGGEVIVMGFVAFVTNAIVRAHYTRRVIPEKQKQDPTA